MSADDASGGFRVEPISETALLLRFGDGMDIAVNERVHAAAAMLRNVELPGLLDLVPAYATLALHYDAAFWAGRDGTLPWQHLAGALRVVLRTLPDFDTSRQPIVEIPVCYDGAFAPDLAEVAAHAGIDADTAVARHCAADYRVAMLGFAPGFAYLLGLDPSLQMPRRAEPRVRVPRGSVAIGGAQTGIYPAELPGGWQLIGRTPLTLFDPQRDPPGALLPGDRVRFRRIDTAEFDAIEAEQRA